MLPIWQDDAPLDARRESARARLMAMCPEPLRLMVQPMVRVAVERATSEEIDALLVDIEQLPGLAESGDFAAITELAKRYGADDQMVAMYMPLFESVTVRARPDDPQF